MKVAPSRELLFLRLLSNKKGRQHDDLSRKPIETINPLPHPNDSSLLNVTTHTIAAILHYPAIKTLSLLNKRLK
jgi:hypothetical protein